MWYARRSAQHLSHLLTCPHVPQLSTGAIIPLELCEVPPGQFVRKRISPDKITSKLPFSTLRPNERMRTIRDGLGVRSEWCTCLPTYNVSPGATTRTITIRTPIRHERFKYARGARSSNPRSPDVKIQPKIPEAQRGIAPLTFLRRRDELMCSNKATERGHVEFVGHVITTGL